MYVYTIPQAPCGTLSNHQSCHVLLLRNPFQYVTLYIITRHPEFCGTDPKMYLKSRILKLGINGPQSSKRTVSLYDLNGSPVTWHFEGTLQHCLHTGNYPKKGLTYSDFIEAVVGFNLKTSVNLDKLHCS